MAVRTYDPKGIAISFGAIPISGLADGVFVTVSRNSDTFAATTGADGDTTRVKSNDKSGICTITLDMTSPTNDELSAVARIDELTNQGTKPLNITDLNGTTKFVSATAWVRKPPEVEFGKETSTREWILDCADMDQFTGGNLLNA